jgi:uncharacterized lipoprotein YddW (UPF0748 family)
MKKTLALLAFTLLVAWPAQASVERALFVSMLQDPSPLSSVEEVERLVEFSAGAGVRTLFVQVYRANRSFFPSTVSDDSPFREARRNAGQDTLELLIRRAHEEGIEVHAWLNLLSLSANTEAPILRRYGPGILAKKPGVKRSLEDYRVDRQFFLEPSDPRVRRTLSSAMGELLRAYPGLDGVQFDYIRYPDWQPFYGYSPLNIRRFGRAHPGKQAVEEEGAWKDWRRSQVSTLVSLLRKKALAMRPGIAVSTTGLMAYSRATHESFQDWKHWLASGLADFVTLMSYAPDMPAFERYIKDAQTHAAPWDRVYLAIGAYRLTSQKATYAQQIERCESAAPRGCAVLAYGDLLAAPELMEI